MPRVSQEHMDSRREQILAAAERCFARNGFHATSMQDIFAEANLSAGAVYRYFPGKTHIVRSIVGRVLDKVIGDFRAAADAERPRPLAEVLIGVFTGRVTSPEAARLRPIVLQVWAEMTRDEEIHSLGIDILGELHRLLARLVERAQQAGEVHPDTDPAAAAQMLLATLQGNIVQLIILGDAVLGNFPESARTLVAGLGHRPMNPGEQAWRGAPPGSGLTRATP